MEVFMADYDVYVFCDECSEVHPMGIRIGLDDGPPAKESIGNLYAGKELPENIANLKNNYITCPNTGRKFTQRNNEQIFLVPAR